MNPYCKGKPHTRHETVRKIDRPNQSLFIYEEGCCQICGGLRVYFPRVIAEGTFHGSLESNPLISHYSGYDR